MKYEVISNAEFEALLPENIKGMSESEFPVGARKMLVSLIKLGDHNTKSLESGCIVCPRNELVKMSRISNSIFFSSRGVLERYGIVKVFSGRGMVGNRGDATKYVIDYSKFQGALRMMSPLEFHQYKVSMAKPQNVIDAEVENERRRVVEPEVSKPKEEVSMEEEIVCVEPEVVDAEFEEVVEQEVTEPSEKINLESNNEKMEEINRIIEETNEKLAKEHERMVNEPIDENEFNKAVSWLAVGHKGVLNPVEGETENGFKRRIISTYRKFQVLR